jgi:hypothetical protein
MTTEHQGQPRSRRAKVAAPSLKDALRERPGAIQGQGQGTPRLRALQDPRSWTKDTIVRRASPPATVCNDFWTAKEFRTFERLTAMVCEPGMEARARARLWLKNFIDKHGKDKCDMMLAEIRRRDEQEWFADKHRTRGA